MDRRFKAKKTITGGGELQKKNTRGNRKAPQGTRLLEPKKRPRTVVVSTAKGETKKQQTGEKQQKKYSYLQR